MKVIRAIETHVGGNAGRVVIGGVGDLAVPGETMFAKKTHMQTHQDWFRGLMLKEPRGGPHNTVNLVLPPCDPRADIGLIIIEQAPYYPAMSGGLVMSVVTAVLETGVLPIRTPTTTVVLDTPAGLVTARASCAGDRVTRVDLTNVPSFATHLDVPISVPGLGEVVVDIAYGGMFYLLVEAARFGLEIEPNAAGDLMRTGELIKNAAREQISVVHPENPQIDYLEQTLWWGPARHAGNHGRNTVVLTPGRARPSSEDTVNAVLDRCPCGTGTSARMAALAARGQLHTGDVFRHEGILDSVFEGRILATAAVGPFEAIVPEIGGSAWITGFSEWILRDDDPYPQGFTIADIWPRSD